MAAPAIIQDDVMKKFCRIEKECNHRGQAIFFLNAMWEECKNDVLKIWECVKLASALDQQMQFGGHALEEFDAHQFLERIGEALTVVEMRKELKSIGIHMGKGMSLLEYLVFQYKVDVAELMSRPQGVNKSVEKAEEALNEVLAEIKKLENTMNALREKVEKGGVKGMAAKNELFQLESSDPLPLRKALVTAQAAVRVAQKSNDVDAMGKLWFVQKELEEAARYKPKGNWKKDTFQPNN